MKKKWKLLNSGMGDISVPNGSRRTSYALWGRWGVPLLLGAVAWLCFCFFSYLNFMRPNAGAQWSRVWT